MHQKLHIPLYEPDITNSIHAINITTKITQTCLRNIWFIKNSYLIYQISSSDKSITSNTLDRGGMNQDAKHCFDEWHKKNTTTIIWKISFFFFLRLSIMPIATGDYHLSKTETTKSLPIKYWKRNFDYVKRALDIFTYNFIMLGTSLHVFHNAIHFNSYQN